MDKREQNGSIGWGQVQTVGESLARVEQREQIPEGGRRWADGRGAPGDSDTGSSWDNEAVLQWWDAVAVGSEWWSELHWQPKLHGGLVEMGSQPGAWEVNPGKE